MTAMLETAADMREGGLITQETLDKITLRQIPPEDRQGLEPLVPEEIRALREGAHMSQAVFARHLNMSPGQLSKLERGTQRPTGPTLALLTVIRRKGIEVVL